jgi:hypothetical protein
MTALKGKLTLWVIVGLLFSATGFFQGECWGATGYLNLIGTRGIPTLGSASSVPYTNPTAGDNWSSIFRYLVPTDSSGTPEGKYLLRYPINLPHGAVITSAAAFVGLSASDSGVNIKAFLRSKPWNVSGNVTQHGSADAGGINGQHTLTITPGSGLQVNNQTTLYWVDVNIYNYIIPHFHGVFGVQVTYTYSGLEGNLFLPVIQKD